MASAPISKLWHQTMATFPNYATGLATRRHLLLIFVVMSADTAKYAAGCAKFPPLKSTDFSVFYVSGAARDSQPRLRILPQLLTYPTPNKGWHRHSMLRLACFATLLPQISPVSPPLCPKFNLWLCLWPLEPIMSKTLPTQWVRP